MWRHPDGERPFATWLREALHEVLVTDAATFEILRNRDGSVCGLDVVDGTTINLLIDITGRFPQPPAPAFEQIIHGRPWRLFTKDELIYAPRNKRPGHIYGHSRVEQILMFINIALRRQIAYVDHTVDGDRCGKCSMFRAPGSCTLGPRGDIATRAFKLGLNGYDGPEILPSSTRPFCLNGADAGHAELAWSASSRPDRLQRYNSGARSSRCPLIPSIRSSLSDERKRQEDSPKSRRRISAFKFVAIRLSRVAEILNILPNTGIDDRLIRPAVRRNRRWLSQGKARIILYRAQPLRQCRIKAPAEEMRTAQYQKGRIHFSDRAKPQRRIDMFDCKIWPVRPSPRQLRGCRI